MKAFVGQGVVLRAMRSSHSASRTVLRSSSFTRAAPARRAARRVSARFVATTSAPSTLETQVREALNKLYNETPCMPIMVRLAWHDAGTFSAKDKTGGANASIRFSPEAGHGANAGLQIARDLLEPIKTQFPDISYADLYQLASVAGIKYSGGPDIPFRMGRKDATEQECTPDGRLPDADKGMGHLRDIFYRMGFNDAEITALSGAHTLGRCHEDRSGYDGPWTKQPVVFDNTYYIEILKDEPDPDLLRLESDLALLSQPDTKALCDKYASDKDWENECANPDICGDNGVCQNILNGGGYKCECDPGYEGDHCETLKPCPPFNTEEIDYSSEDQFKEITISGDTVDGRKPFDIFSVTSDIKLLPGNEMVLQFSSPVNVAKVSMELLQASGVTVELYANGQLVASSGQISADPTSPTFVPAMFDFDPVASGVTEAKLIFDYGMASEIFARALVFVTCPFNTA